MVIAKNKTYSWTISKWNQLVNSGILDDEKVELIKGEIIKMSPESTDHAFFVGRIARILRSHFELSRKAVIREAHPITLEHSEPEPDVALVQYPEYLYFQNHPLPVNIFLLVEVSRTTLKFDLNQKFALYAEAGIPAYWILDLKNQKLIIFSDVDRSLRLYRTKREIFKDEKVEIILPSFPNITIPNLDIWKL